MTNGDNRNTDLNRFWDSVPECQWVPQCHRLFERDGCDGCECMDGTLLRDDDGDVIGIRRPPEDLEG